jgi:hypothetical protein
MPARTIWLSRFLGSFALIMGLGMLVRAADFAALMALVVADRPLLLLIGVVALSAGLAIVLTHNVWSGSVAAVIVTIAGWLSALRGVFILLLPADVSTRLLGAIHLVALEHFYAAVFIILGLFLTYAGFSARAPAAAGPI